MAWILYPGIDNEGTLPMMADKDIDPMLSKDHEKYCVSWVICSSPSDSVLSLTSIHVPREMAYSDVSWRQSQPKP